MNLSDELVGRTFGPDGQYRIDKKLGEGGMGVVFRAHDLKHDRTVALKFLRTDGPVDAEAITRFKNEGKRFGALRHPNLVRIYALGREESCFYIASEFVDGLNLYQILVKDGAFPVDRALATISDAALGLGEAHRQAVVHRDLKPENIMVRTADGVVKVLDFGIAKDMNQSVQLTRPGTYIGTPAYSAPEQIRGDPIDARADIFSLGVILYEMLTGKVAFQGRHTNEVLQSTLKREPIAITKLNQSVTVPVANLLERMIKKNPARRPSTCEEVCAEIERVRNALKAGCSAEEEAGIRGLLRKLFGGD